MFRAAPRTSFYAVECSDPISESDSISKSDCVGHSDISDANSVSPQVIDASVPSFVLGSSSKPGGSRCQQSRDIVEVVLIQ